MKLREGTPEEAGMSADRVGNIKKLTASWVDKGITPALVVFAARRGIIVLHEAFGRLTPEEDSPPLKRDTIFPLSSITKPLTATAAMVLVEDGVMGLNRRVSDYIPEFCGEGKDAVMVHHLLTHTSGLNEAELAAHEEKKRGTVEIPPPDATQHPAVNEVLLMRYDAPLWKPPGEEMSYCSFNYDLMGEIVRRLSGRSLNDFARERILGPLAMKDTHYVVPETARHRVVLRSPDGPEAERGTPEGMDNPRASGGSGGGAYSTAMDMAVFGQMFLNGGRHGDARILSSTSVTEMTRNQIPGIGAWLEDEYHVEASWGYGWAIQGEGEWAYYSPTLSTHESYSHGGAGGVYLWVDPVYELVGVYFSVIREALGRFRLVWNQDLFANAVTAAIDE